MARKHSEEGDDEKDKWRLRIKLKSWSHSIRQNQLLQWNEGTTKVKLFKGAEHNDLTAEFTVPKSITIHGLWNAGMQNNVLFVPELATSSAALVESSSSAICAGAVPVARSQPGPRVFRFGRSKPRGARHGRRSGIRVWRRASSGIHLGSCFTSRAGRMLILPAPRRGAIGFRAAQDSGRT